MEGSGKAVTELAKTDLTQVVAGDVLALWERASIPAISSRQVHRRLISEVIDTERKIMRNKRTMGTLNLDSLFDICQDLQQCSCSRERKVQP